VEITALWPTLQWHTGDRLDLTHNHQTCTDTFFGSIWNVATCIPK